MHNVQSLSSLESAVANVSLELAVANVQQAIPTQFTGFSRTNSTFTTANSSDYPLVDTSANSLLLQQAQLPNIILSQVCIPHLKKAIIFKLLN